MDSNKAVVAAWCNGREAESNSMSTDGKILYSYKLEIARVMDGQPIIWNYTGDKSISATTSKHIHLAIRASPSADLMSPIKKQ